ncbi:MAG: 4Fe-4S dicluster domain-containing protein [Peptococcaceae bacterium]|nr:4Fe-4S dicluster domain-containing protein [Peptococcaceae bacterium]
MITEKMRDVAKDLLTKGEVNMVIGWEKGTFWYNSTPVFITKAEDVERLVFDEFCTNNLAKYLLDYKTAEGKVAIFVKGCDARAVNRLMQDQQVQRDKVYLLGIPCGGMKEAAPGTQPQATEGLPLVEKCQNCTSPNPVVFDVLLGDQVSVRDTQNRFAAVEKLEALGTDEKYAYWGEMFDKCIRCYACRNVCPACSCRECAFDGNGLNWLGKQNNLQENQMFNITRAMHVAGRCIECGECERVCPMDLPLMAINRKVIKDLNELFGAYEAGMDVENRPPLGQFKLEDPEKFM